METLFRLTGAIDFILEVASMGETYLAVDVGGTFTDVCVFDETNGSISVAKVPSSTDVIEGVANGIRRTGIELSRTKTFTHGTTVATNALITRNLPQTGMLTTKGFRDVIEIRRGNREDLWDAYKDVAAPHIRRRDRLVVTERVAYDGEVVEPLNESEVHEAAAILRDRCVEGVAVCFINAHANPEHEIAAKAILEKELPGVSVCTSSEVLPELFEHERFSTAVNNTVLAPLIGRYIDALRRKIAEEGYRSDLLLLHSGGGVMTSDLAQTYPARLAGSGPAAGAIASRHIAKMAGFDNAISLDMGGTSTDIALTANGELHTTKQWSVEFGYPIGFPSIDVITIGAGGGSVAWLDEAAALQSGPQSAGADPGPASYKRGGIEPTTTDANLLLGRQGSQLVGGDMMLDYNEARDALTHQVGTSLDLEANQAAEAIIEVANANIADAARLVSIQRGYDPRDFCLVAMGGAGPMHAVAVAQELSIPTVLIPPHPGVTSALGCLLVDVRHDLTRMMVALTDDIPIETVGEAYINLEQQARDLLDGEGIPDERQQLIRTIDMRYRGQWRSISIPVPPQLSSWMEILSRFYDEYERQHKFRREDTPVEMYRIGMCGLGLRDKPTSLAQPPARTDPHPQTTRPVIFSTADGANDAAVYDRSLLAIGKIISGPAIIEQVDSTVVVPPEATAEVDNQLNLHINVRTGPDLAEG